MAVQRNLLGRTGEEVSRLGFGCMRLPQSFTGRVDEELTERMIDRALEAGINYFDTAYMYHDGASEAIVGKYLGKHPRESFYITDKLPLSQIDSLAEAKRIFAEQQKRLGLGVIDHYLLHNVNNGNWKRLLRLGLADYLEELKASGQVRFIGFSFHGDYPLFEEVLGSRSWDLCQIQYNYIDRDTQAGDRGYELAKKMDIPMVIMEPVKGGTLSNLSPDLLEIFQKIHRRRSSASWALRWVAEHDNARVILSGMSDTAQLEDNIRSFSPPKPLSEEEHEAIDKVVEIIRSRRGNDCTGCGYCLPCYKSVNIPAVFKAWNTYRQYQNFELVAEDWMQLPEAQKPTRCMRCGRCEGLCPQHISIREDLQKAMEELDHPKYFG